MFVSCFFIQYDHPYHLTAVFRRLILNVIINIFIFKLTVLLFIFYFSPFFFPVFVFQERPAITSDQWWGGLQSLLCSRKLCFLGGEGLGFVSVTSGSLWLLVCVTTRLCQIYGLPQPCSRAPNKSLLLGQAGLKCHSPLYLGFRYSLQLPLFSSYLIFLQLPFLLAVYQR